MDQKSRLMAAFDLQKTDRPPILGGWLAHPAAIQEICTIDEDTYWQDTLHWMIEAEKRLGSDGLMDALLPIHRGEYRNIDSHTLEVRAQYSSLDMVIEEIQAMPDPDAIRESFDEEAAYRDFIAKYQAMQRMCSPMQWLPADWEVIPIGLRYHRYGYENALTLPLLYPGVFTRYLHIHAELGHQRAVLHARAMREGIELPCFLTGEDLCSQAGPMVSPALLRKEYWPLVEYAIEPLLQAGAKLIWHCDGNVRPILNDVLACGFAGLQGFQSECGVTMDLVANLKTIGGDPLIIFGPMSVTKTLPFGTPQDVQAEVRRVMKTYGSRVSLIFFTSSSINPDVPVENIRAFWNTVLESSW